MLPFFVPGIIYRLLKAFFNGNELSALTPRSQGSILPGSWEIHRKTNGTDFEDRGLWDPRLEDAEFLSWKSKKESPHRLKDGRYLAESTVMGFPKRYSF